MSLVVAQDFCIDLGRAATRKVPYGIHRSTSNCDRRAHHYVRRGLAARGAASAVGIQGLTPLAAERRMGQKHFKASCTPAGMDENSSWLVLGRFASLFSLEKLSRGREGLFPRWVRFGRSRVGSRPTWLMESNHPGPAMPFDVFPLHQIKKVG